MIPWINLLVLVLSSLLMLIFYQLSVGPAALEKVVGAIAYSRCGRYRIIASIFEVVVAVCYVVYYFYPLPVPLPRLFPWAYPLSAAIAILILIPSGGLMLRGLLDAGRESLYPDKSHTMYAGIYAIIRHPQAFGEVWLWWVVALLLNSPFLAVFSLIYIPIFLSMTWAEEHDLLLRYGDAYAEYMRKTGAFLPRIGKQA